MAHPYASHKADKVAKAAAKARIKGYASGGKVSHSREASSTPGAGESSRGSRSSQVTPPGGSFTGGAEGGLGRLQKARAAKRMRG